MHRPCAEPRQPDPVRGDVSSQFLTGLLQALCLVRAEHDVSIEVVAADLQALHRDHAEAARAVWRGRAQRRLRALVIPAGSSLRSPGELHVEGDASSASYFVALGAIAAEAAAPLRIEAWGARRSRAMSRSSRPRRRWART